MGPYTQIEGVRSVLADGLANEWISKGLEAQRQGWFWKYTLRGLQVQKIGKTINDRVPASGDGAVFVQCKIHETATLWGKDGSVEAQYRDPYLIEYEIRPVNGVWKIAASRIL